MALRSKVLFGAPLEGAAFKCPVPRAAEGRASFVRNMPAGARAEAPRGFHSVRYAECFFGALSISPIMAATKQLQAAMTNGIHQAPTSPPFAASLK